MSLNKEQIINTVVTFLEKEVSTFLKEHSNEDFYGLAIGASGNDNCYIILYFATEKYFENLLADEDDDFKNNEEDVYEYKYSVADWKYPEFAECEVLSQDELFEYYDTQVTSREDEGWGTIEHYEPILDLYCEALVAFEKTGIYQNIPKTEDFKLLCAEHDGYIEDFENRMHKVRSLIGESK